MRYAFAKTLGAAALAFGCAFPAFADFSGPYALSNWTTTFGPGTPQGGGTTVDTSGGPGVLGFLGGDSGCVGGSCIVTFSITVPQAGNIDFDWATETQDTGFEWFGFGLNAVNTTLATQTDNGSASIPVAANDTFAFWYDCTDCDLGPGNAYVRSFSGPGGGGSVPEPATLALLGLGLIGLGASRLRVGRR